MTDGNKVQWEKGQGSTSTQSYIASPYSFRLIAILLTWSELTSHLLSARLCAPWLLPGLGLGMYPQGTDGEWEGSRQASFLGSLLAWWWFAGSLVGTLSHAAFP